MCFAVVFTNISSSPFLFFYQITYCVFHVLIQGTLFPHSRMKAVGGQRFCLLFLLFPKFNKRCLVSQEHMLMDAISGNCKLIFAQQVLQNPPRTSNLLLVVSTHFSHLCTSCRMRFNAFTTAKQEEQSPVFCENSKWGRDYNSCG